MLAKLLSMWDWIDKRVLAGLIAGLSLWFIGYVGGKRGEINKGKEVASKDTKRQTKWDKREDRRDDEEAVDEFIDKFGPV